MLKKEEVAHISRLARLSLSPEELEQYTQQLNAIFELFKKLEKVNTEGVEPTSFVVACEPLLREDCVEASLPFEAWENIVPARQGHFILVPQVLKE